jgi:hypothetical protein
LCASCGEEVQHAQLTGDDAVICLGCANTFYVTQMHLRMAAVWSTPSWLVESVLPDVDYVGRLRAMGPTAKTALLQDVAELVMRKKNHALATEPFRTYGGEFKFVVGSTVTCCHCGIEGVVEQGRYAMNFSVAPDLVCGEVPHWEQSRAQALVGSQKVPPFLLCDKCRVARNLVPVGAECDLCKLALKYNHCSMAERSLLWARTGVVQTTLLHVTGKEPLVPALQR